MFSAVGTIFKKELKSYFNSPMAYIFLVVFAIVNGYFFTNTFFLFNQSNMRALFNIVPDYPTSPPPPPEEIPQNQAPPPQIGGLG